MVLTSGGLDSTTLLALAHAEGRRIHALSFRYGQRHAVELQCAARQAERFAAVAHETVDLAHLGRLLAPATSWQVRHGAELSAFSRAHSRSAMAQR